MLLKLRLRRAYACPSHSIRACVEIWRLPRGLKFPAGNRYKLEAGKCVAQARPFWQHTERAVSIALGILASLIFCCGLVAFRLAPSERQSGDPDERTGDMALAEFGSAFKHSAPSGYRKLPVEDTDV